MSTRATFGFALLMMLGACGRIGYQPTSKTDASSRVDSGFDATANSNPYNLIFVTSTQIRAGELGSIDAADALCNARAQSAQLPGIYKAWLSTSTVNAKDRFAGARGWVRMDGKPVFDQIADVTNNVLFYPVVFDELGVSYASSNAEYAVTGTLESGVVSVNKNCSDWTNMSGASVAQAGELTQTVMRWTNSTQVACNAPARIYCLGIDKNAALTITPMAGPLAFVSSPWANNTGVAGADTLCQNDANAAGLVGTFIALLTTTTMLAGNRFNQTGDIWVRLDGIPITASRARLYSGFLDAPVSLTANKTYVSDLTWNGGALSGVSANTTCQDWSTSASNVQGSFIYSSGMVEAGFGGGGASCAISGRVLCFQSP